MKKISKIIIICMFLANYVNASQTINIGFQNFNFNSTAHTLSFDVYAGKGANYSTIWTAMTIRYDLATTPAATTVTSLAVSNMVISNRNTTYTTSLVSQLVASAAGTLPGYSYRCGIGPANLASVDLPNTGTVQLCTITLTLPATVTSVDSIRLRVNTTNAAGTSTATGSNWGDSSKYFAAINPTAPLVSTWVLAPSCTGGDWLGGSDSSWSNSANWCPDGTFIGGLPSATTNVNIPLGKPRYPVVATATAVCNNLTFATGIDSAMIYGGGMLTVNGAITGLSSAKFIRTKGFGKLALPCPAGTPVTFNVGDMSGAYNPVIVNNAAAGVYAVALVDQVDANGTTGSPIQASATTPTARSTYDITPIGATVPNATITLQYNDEDIAGSPSFSTDSVYIAHYNTTTNAWENFLANVNDTFFRPTTANLVPAPVMQGSLPAGTITGSHLMSLSGVTSFSPFAVASKPGPGTGLGSTFNTISARNDNDKNIVDWTTLNETDMDHFEIERSIDGKNFTKIGSTKATGKAYNYSFYDETPYNGKNFYRLRVVEVSGKATLTKIVTATVNGNITISAIPNPAHDVITVTADGKVQPNATIYLSDVSGKMIESHILDAKSTNKVQFNLTNLAAGMYMVKYEDNNNTKVIKVEKQ